MSRLLLPSSPIYGHVLPMVTIASGLAARGHEVTVLTGRKYRALVEDAGVGFRALPASVDYDDADMRAVVGPAARSRNPLAVAPATIRSVFIARLADQYRCLAEELQTGLYDAVVSDTAFLGTVPLTLLTPGARPPVFGVSVTPLSLRSADTAHFGSALRPDGITYHRRRNAQIDWLLSHGPLRSLQRDLDRALAPFGGVAGELNYFDAVATHDLTFHLGPREFEYPRREMPDSMRFVGPLRYPDARDLALPEWWGSFAAHAPGVPVVHVTQGTLDTADPTKLIIPTLSGLAGSDVLVVASTGRRPVSTVTSHFPRGLPENARVAEFLPYDALLPRCDVVVTNGGYGGVLRTLAGGVPLVVAGGGEDKPEVAARVAWSGCGVNLHTGRPAAWRVRRAVGKVLGDDSYKKRAREMASSIAKLGDPVEAIDEALRDLR